MLFRSDSTTQKEGDTTFVAADDIANPTSSTTNLRAITENPSGTSSSLFSIREDEEEARYRCRNGDEEKSRDRNSKAAEEEEGEESRDDSGAAVTEMKHNPAAAATTDRGEGGDPNLPSLFDSCSETQTKHFEPLFVEENTYKVVRSRSGNNRV